MDAKSQAARSGQKRRTRTAILAATVELLRAGSFPSVAQAAEAADVSRRTAYRYFPTQERLLTEAALESLRPGVESSFTAIDKDPFLRIETAVRAMQDRAAANEPLLRTMIRLTVERGVDEPPGVRPAARGTRRIEWIESALAPVRQNLSKAAFSQLVSSISLCVGAEALIVLRDVRGLAQSAAIDVSAWTAVTLLRGALDQAEAARRSGVRRK